MEVTLSAELQERLARIAEERGTNPQELAREAIERLVDYDRWFVREVEKGLAQIEGGRTLTHEEIGTRLKKHVAGKQPR
jgi:predicted transcriptional regulator